MTKKPKPKLIANLDLSPRTESLLLGMGAKTLEDVTRFTPDDILGAQDADGARLNSIRRLLGAHGLSLKGEAPADPNDYRGVFQESWGCLYLYLVGAEPLKRTRQILVDLHQPCGLAPWPEEKLHPYPDPDDPEGTEWIYDDPVAEHSNDFWMNRSPTLGEDEILVAANEAPAISVMSMGWAWAFPGENVLAKELSRFGPVLAATGILAKYDELSLYLDGALARISLSGRLPPKGAPGGLPLIDPEWFVGRGPAIEVRELAASLSDADKFVDLLGLDGRGIRAAFEDASIEDWGSESLLVFRPKSESSS